MENKVIEIVKETIVGTIILEKGDKIEVLSEGLDYEFEDEYKACNQAVTNMDFSNDNPNIQRYIADIDKALLGIEKYMDQNNLWSHTR